MDIIKRDNTNEKFDPIKIYNAIQSAFTYTGESCNDSGRTIDDIVNAIVSDVSMQSICTVEIKIN